jgi:hypothetical protein
MDICNKMFEELITRDIGSISRSAGSELLDGRRIKLSFFNREIIVEPYKKAIFYTCEGEPGAEEPLDAYSSSLVLHYLLNADGTPLTGRWVSYRELPGGLFYWKTIPGVLEPLIKKYESDGDAFLKKSLEIGGERYKQFRFASIVHPFKMFPVLIIFDEKSTEFEADARMLFDGSAPHYLKTDAVKLIIIYIVKKLCA